MMSTGTGPVAEPLLRVRQVRSAIGTKPKHRGTLRALRLGRVGRSVTVPDRPEIRGMIARVAHLVEVGAAPPEPTAQPVAATAKPQAPAPAPEPTAQPEAIPWTEASE